MENISNEYFKNIKDDMRRKKKKSRIPSDDDGRFRGREIEVFVFADRGKECQKNEKGNIRICWISWVDAAGQDTRLFWQLLGSMKLFPHAHHDLLHEEAAAASAVRGLLLDWLTGLLENH